MFLAIVAFVLSIVYLEPNVKSFFISTFMANKVGSENILEIIIFKKKIYIGIIHVKIESSKMTDKNNCIMNCLCNKKEK